MRCAVVLEFDNGEGSVAKRVEVMHAVSQAHRNQTPGDLGSVTRRGQVFVQFCATGLRSRADRTFLRLA